MSRRNSDRNPKLTSLIETMFKMFSRKSDIEKCTQYLEEQFIDKKITSNKAHRRNLWLKFCRALISVNRCRDASQSKSLLDYEVNKLVEYLEGMDWITFNKNWEEDIPKMIEEFQVSINLINNDNHVVPQKIEDSVIIILL